MYALMDHEDIAKSRKALLATSVLLIVLHSFQISGQTINIFGLQAKFDKDLSLGLCGLAVFYFLYVFIMRVDESKIFEIIEYHIEQYKSNLNIAGLELEAARLNLDDYENKSMMRPGIEFGSYKNWIFSISSKLDSILNSLKITSFLLVDVGPPVLFSIFALHKTRALTYVISLISSG